jgi:DNA excision repair protein ERCC-4
VPTQQVTGLLVANAHRVHDRSNVAFAVRIFRQENESGFIKAFSDDAHGFTHGFARAEKAMCLLRVHRLQLWPRFRCEVNRMLQGCQPEVEEVGVRLSQRASQLQRALLQAVDSCLQELRSLNGSAIDVSSFTVENSLFKSFDTIVRMQLNPFWHKTSKRTQSLANDLPLRSPPPFLKPDSPHAPLARHHRGHPLRYRRRSKPSQPRRTARRQ